MITSKLTKLFTNNKNSNKWEGTIKLSFEKEESVYLLELLIKKDERIVVYDLNELNCLFEAKFKKAYTVAQYQAMSKVLMVLDGVSTSNIHLFSGCEYKNGKIGFEKGTYFKLCSCLIESRRSLREKGKGKEKSKALPLQEKNINVPKKENPALLPKQLLPKQKIEQDKNTMNDNDVTEKNADVGDTGGISKEDFKKQIQARKNK